MATNHNKIPEEVQRFTGSSEHTKMVPKSNATEFRLAESLSTPTGFLITPGNQLRDRMHRIPLPAKTGSGSLKKRGEKSKPAPEQAQIQEYVANTSLRLSIPYRLSSISNLGTGCALQVHK